MQGYQLFMLVLAGYILLLVGTGCYFKKRQRSLREFLLAGRRAGPLSIGFSAAASWLTAGALLAVIGFFMLLGMGSVWGFVAPNIIALLGIAALVGKIRSIPAMTQPELIEIRYGAWLRTPVALIIIVVMILFAVADIKGFALVLQVFYGIDSLPAALIVGLSVAVYVTLGGLAAVIATDVVQYLCLACCTILLAVLVVAAAGEHSGLTVQAMAAGLDGSWWNPLSIGLPMVLIFTLAIIPGWISEQDPWQKVWAARDAGSARTGMVVGALLVALVFAGCALIAAGLRIIYPDIVALGFPQGMAKAEPALLRFILDQGFSELSVALIAIALATAAMSCADTFAASGASCIARDIYQRRINPAASMGQMLTVNRFGILFIVGCATVGSLYIGSIIDAIHIATFIASASYFFVLMGGLYWRRGTTAGAVASMLVGFVCQTSLVAVDLLHGEAGGPGYLESIHPVLMGHGVIVAMAASGLTYFAVSLVTARSEAFRLAPFFPDQAQLLAAGHYRRPAGDPIPAEESIRTENGRAMVYHQVSVDLPAHLDWQDVIRLLTKAHPHWISLCGPDSVRRCTRTDMLTCVSLVRGESRSGAWLEVEGAAALAAELRDEVSAAYREIRGTLAGQSG